MDTATARTINALIDRVARGRYQRAILTGQARISGADLKGRARKWGAHYRRSRESAIRRFNEALFWEFEWRYETRVIKCVRTNVLAVHDCETGIDTAVWKFAAIH